MKGLTIIAAAAMLSASFTGAALAQGMSKEAQIKTATSALPAALRDGATVISYDSKGLPQVLRQGDNHIFCANLSTAESFSVSCRGDSLRAASDFTAKEKAEGKDAKAIAADTDAAYAAGKLTRAPAGSTIYGRSGKTEDTAREMWVVLMPNVKGEDLGLPTKRMNASSPWMMRSGTPGAHIMMPQTASMDDMPPPPPKGM
ncbi:MAG TPA: hypothetical protein VHX92_01105 [Rhizomicrobium sp.]|jgi:hypothetical protein|nr:hypothetical protein [Rhizomicrobium sp.]